MMHEPEWVELDDVLDMYKEQSSEFETSAGVRDQNLLESALNKAKQLYYYGGETIDLASLATAYAYGIAKNHPFIDGNKRTASLVYETFLKINGINLTANDESCYQSMLSLASGDLSEADFATWIRENSAKS